MIEVLHHRHGLFAWLLVLLWQLSGCQTMLPVETTGVRLSGPMPGYAGPASVRLWLQSRTEEQVRIRYWPVQSPETIRYTDTITTDKNTDFTHTFDITGLSPGQKYQYQVLLSGSEYKTASPLYFKTQSQWRWYRNIPEFNVILGSCAIIEDASTDPPGSSWGSHYQIFDTIARRAPDLMLWLGDNIYLRNTDYTSPAGMAYRYRQVRSFEPLQGLLNSTHHVATWDDHDYGPDNSGRSFIHKATSVELFRRYWPNPSYGLPEVPGIFTLLEYQDVDFFLLDDRYYRDSERNPDAEQGVMFGEKQMAWLKDALSRSRASFRFIVSGSQFFSDLKRVERFTAFQREYDNLMDWLKRANIPGIVFLSGDRHYTALYKQENEDHYPYYELTCSPLTSFLSKGRKDVMRTDVVPGTHTIDHNFCQLKFTGERGKRVLEISVYNDEGNLLWQENISQAELRKTKNRN